jgi:ParB family chromosome partitioning protein
VKIENLPLSEILIDNDWNCRGPIAPYEIAELVKDIDKRGLLQPVIVAPHGVDGFKYKLIAGYCRAYAHKLLRKTEIQAVVHPDLVDEIEARTINLSENIQRKDLNLLQEAKALGRFTALGLTEEDIAERIGKSRGWVQVRTMLLKMPEDIQKNVAAGLITQKQIRGLYTLYTRAELTGNTDPLYEAVRKIKNARENGKTIDVAPSRRKLTSKRHRKRPEIFKMIEHLLDTVDAGLHTKALAWAAGEINTYEFYEAVQTFAEENGIEYEKPRS